MSQKADLKQKGNDAFAKNNFEEAIFMYEEALKVEGPESENAAAIFSNIAACLFNLNKFEEGLKKADESIRLRGNWHRGHFRRGACLEKLGQFEEASKSYMKAIELEPRDGDARNGHLRCSKVLREKKLATMTDEEKKQEKQEALKKLREHLMSLPEADLVRRNKADQFMLHDCMEKDLEEVKIAVECGAVVNPPDDMKVPFTALLIAVDRQANDIIKFLLENKAEVDRAVEANKTPLIVSSLVGNLEAVKLLIEHGAEIEAETEDNLSRPLHLAAHAGHHEIVQYLLDLGAEHSPRDKFNATPLTWAVTQGHAECTRILIEAGSSQLNAGPSAKETCLMLAAGAGHSPVVKVLLEKFVGEAEEVEQALLEAIKHNHLEATIDLLNSFGDFSRDGKLPHKTAVKAFSYCCAPEVNAEANQHHNVKIATEVLKHVADPKKVGDDVSKTKHDLTTLKLALEAVGIKK